MPATRTALIKVSGVMVYASDALGNLSAGVRYTAEPLDLTGATITDGVATAGADFQACHGVLSDPIPCAENPGVTTRRVTVIAQQQAGADAPIRRLSKEIPLNNLNNLVACMTAVGQLGVCLAYNGESIDYADVLLGV
ncbi:MAG: hypothetical protein HC773_05580 [Scytonema sp. CRU_2_7]|nr:hypothetical protein [Scytonema sp. CRU_2_7]